MLHGKLRCLFGTTSGSGKSLSYEVITIVFGETTVILIVASLVGITKEQVERLNFVLGYRTLFTEPNTDFEVVANGHNFVFGRPEVLVGDPSWRNTVRSYEFVERLRLIVVDKSQIILHW